jgi:hypothetical protein
VLGDFSLPLSLSANLSPGVLFPFGKFVWRQSPATANPLQHLRATGFPTSPTTARFYYSFYYPRGKFSAGLTTHQPCTARAAGGRLSGRLGLGWRAASSSAAGAARADGALLCRNRIAGAGRHRICSQAGARGPTQGIKRAVSRPSTRVAPRCSSESYDWGATCLPPHTFLLAAAEAASALTPPAPHLAGTTSASQRAWLCHQTVTCTTLARRPAARARWCATRTC